MSTPAIIIYCTTQNCLYIKQDVWSFIGIHPSSGGKVALVSTRKFSTQGNFCGKHSPSQQQNNKPYLATDMIFKRRSLVLISTANAPIVQKVHLAVAMSFSKTLVLIVSESCIILKNRIRSDRSK